MLIWLWERVSVGLPKMTFPNAHLSATLRYSALLSHSPFTLPAQHFSTTYQWSTGHGARVLSWLWEGGRKAVKNWRSADTADTADTPVQCRGCSRWRRRQRASRVRAQWRRWRRRAAQMWLCCSSGSIEEVVYLGVDTVLEDDEGDEGEVLCPHFDRKHPDMSYRR